MNCLVVRQRNCFAQTRKRKLIMTIDEAIKQIKTCASQMNDRYGSTVFDEWAVLSLPKDKARVLAYIGPRNDAFLGNFAKDLGPLRTELHDSKYSTGDFEFARHGVGTGFEAFMVMGDGLYLICNNTTSSMTEITKNPKWLNAQVPFAELSDKVRSSPLTLTY
jgi:hypothetical protein